MDLSPTDLRLVSYDLYKTDEKYDFKLTDILRRRHRPVWLILDSFGDLVYSCRPDEVSPDERSTPVITEKLLKQAFREARCLINGEDESAGSVTRRVTIDKPDEKCALIVMDNQFWCVRVFELDGGVLMSTSASPHWSTQSAAHNPETWTWKKSKGCFGCRNVRLMSLKN